MREVSASDPRGIFIAFVITSPNRIISIGFAASGFQFFSMKFQGADNGQTLGGAALKATGVPPGDYFLTLNATDDQNCYGSTGAARIVRVTP